MTSGLEAVADEEDVYRRVPARQEFVEDSSVRRPSPAAFRPREHDRDGLSLSRAKLTTPEKAADRGPGKTTFLARLQVRDIRSLRLDVLASPPPPEHCTIPQLNAATRKETWALELQRRLAYEFSTLIGPFESAARE